jgi:hypothetical protein
VTSVLKEYLGKECVAVRVREKFPAVTWLQEYPSEPDSSKILDLYRHMCEAQDHNACIKTFEEGLRICMICGYDFWSTIWVSR